MSDFTTSITIANDPAGVFAAVLDARGWWNTAIDGPTARVGDEFGFEVQGLHRTRIRVTEVTPNQRIEWLVVDNAFGFVSDQSEWVGDRIVFELRPIDDRTQLTFTQYGLVPEQECYDVCSNAWSFFVRDSLRLLAEAGQGMPESAAGEAAPAEKARAAVDTLRGQSLDDVPSGTALVSPTLKPGSIILGSTQPARLRDWYLKVLAPRPDGDRSAHGGEGPIHLDDFTLVIEGRDDVEAQNAEPGRTIVNFHVDDFDAVETRLRAAGVEWLTPVADRPSGKFGTFSDPDGNLLQIIQFA